MWSWKFLPTPGRSWTTWMPTAAQLVGRPDAGEQQEPGELTAPPLRDDLAARMTRASVGLSLARYWTPTARPFSMISWVAWRVRLRSVRFLRLRAGLEERGRGAFPPDVSLGHVVEADAGLLGPVEVVAERDADLWPARTKPLVIGLCCTCSVTFIGAAGAVVLVGEALVVLGLAEVRQDAVVAPAVVAERRPLVVVEPVAADVDHRVDRRAAAERAALRVLHPRSFSSGCGTVESPS